MDGCNGNEGVGSDADRKRTRIDELLQFRMLLDKASCCVEVGAP